MLEALLIQRLMDTPLSSFKGNQLRPNHLQQLASSGQQHTARQPPAHIEVDGRSCREDAMYDASKADRVVGWEVFTPSCEPRGVELPVRMGWIVMRLKESLLQRD